MGIAYILFVRGLSVVPAAEASLLGMLEPTFNPLWAFLGIGEKPRGWALLGGAVVLIAVAARTVAGSAGGAVEGRVRTLGGERHGTSEASPAAACSTRSAITAPGDDRSSDRARFESRGVRLRRRRDRR